MTAAFTGGVTLKRGDGTTPTEVFTSIPEMTVSPNLGADKGQIEVSSYDSIDNKEYIAEFLGDGKDVDLEWQLILGNAQQESIVSDVNGGINRNYEMTITDGVKTLTSTFTLTPKSWNRSTSLTDAHKLSATFKISGAITDVVTPT